MVLTQLSSSRAYLSLRELLVQQESQPECGGEVWEGYGKFQRARRKAGHTGRGVLGRFSAGAGIRVGGGEVDTGDAVPTLSRTGGAGSCGEEE